MSYINKKLIPSKLLLFTFYGAIGCLMPFLTLQMTVIGLSHGSVTIINAIISVMAMFGPPVVGAIADKFANHRTVTVATMMLAVLFHTILLYIPASVTHEFAPSRMALVSDVNSTFLLVDGCEGYCPSAPPDAPLSFRTRECRYSCNSEKHAFLRTPINNTEDVQISQRQICSPDSDQCFSVDSLVQEVFNQSINSPLHRKVDDTSVCVYPSQSPLYPPDRRLSLGCHIFCDVDVNIQAVDTQGTRCQGSNYETGLDVYQKKGQAMQDVSCSKTYGNENLTFWIYLLMRALADMCTASLIVLLDALTLTMVAQYNGDFGRDKMVGLFSVGVFAAIVGYLLDSFGSTDYSIGFYVFDGLMVLAMFLTFLLPFKIETKKTSMVENLRKLFHTHEVFVLLIIMIAMGSLYGCMETFFYIYLNDLCASNFLVGLTVTIGITTSIPFLYRSESIIKYCGHHYLLMLAFLGYCVRFIGLSFLSNPWWSLIYEVLELFTINLMIVTAITLAYYLAPKELMVTAQALVWLSHFNIGRCLGTFIGGYFINMFGIVRTFQGSSVVSLIFACVYFILYQAMKYCRRREPQESATQPPLDACNCRGRTLNSNSYVSVPLQEVQKINGFTSSSRAT